MIKKNRMIITIITRWGIIIISSILIFIILPYSIWKARTDFENIEKRLKITTGKVIEITRSKRINVRVMYIIDGHKYEKVRTPPSIQDMRIGDDVHIRYDSLDYENVQVIWE